MEKPQKNSKGDVFLAVNECVAGRRRRLSETIAIHAMVSSRKQTAPAFVFEQSGQRPEL
ncbi:hypothetical protein [Pseudomonas savastanoi]|uniref:hypothetical protein n=1 Tax=Pseudomonas savastanoi TaxID=29438 RepID=UPI00177C515F|nr:hypothetical protein [Pseudomonas savastanoi]QOQ33455.1 hypothetical protein [Pseudomonas syringae pv. actinidiae]